MACDSLLKIRDRFKSHSLATTRYNKPISGSVRMTCDSLLTIDLLQVGNKLVAGSLSKLVIHKLATRSFFKAFWASQKHHSCCQLSILATCYNSSTSCNKLVNFMKLKQGS